MFAKDVKNANCWIWFWAWNAKICPHTIVPCVIARKRTTKSSDYHELLQFGMLFQEQDGMQTLEVKGLSYLMISLGKKTMNF